jgi:hypothetical protein
MPLLDWSNPVRHWSWDPAACRYCGRLTHLRDSKGSPAHKVCAEQALDQQATERAEDRAQGLI